MIFKKPLLNAKENQWEGYRKKNKVRRPAE